MGRFGELGHPYTHPSSKQCDAAAGYHTHPASAITSGILPVSRGGTGYSDLNSLKSALGVNSNLLYNNTSVKNYTRALIKFPYKYSGSSEGVVPGSWPLNPQSYSVTIPFVPSRIIFKDVFPNTQTWLNGYSSLTLNAICGTPNVQTSIAMGANSNNRNMYLYMKYSGTTISVVLKGSGYYSDTCPNVTGDYWTFAIDCILDC